MKIRPSCINIIFWFQKSGNITYNGHTLDDFCIQRTSAYISQTDNHIAEMTVRETLDFAARCEGASEGFAGLSHMSGNIPICLKYFVFSLVLVK